MIAACAWPRFAIPFHRPAELRVDVDPASTGTGHAADSFDSLYERLYSPGDSLYGLETIGLPDPHLKIRVRVADGEYYAYVEDTRRACLAGWTVLNRLVEVDRRADRHLRSPHSRYRPEYQRRGIATGVYEWALATGICLLTGARQSAGAHALWTSLAQKYESGFVDLRDKRLTYLGRQVAPRTLERLQTRMFLIGHAWSLAQFFGAVRIADQADPG